MYNSVNLPLSKKKILKKTLHNAGSWLPPLILIGVVFLAGCGQIVSQTQPTITAPQGEANIYNNLEQVSEKKIYPPQNFIFENKYPENVQIEIKYIPDLPKETEYGPCNIYGQDALYQEKEIISNSNIGDFCQVTSECGGTINAVTFCQIQKHGDSKGKLEIYGSPNDGEMISIRYTFYKDNYEVIIWPYNSFCGQNKKCGFRIWDGFTKRVNIKEIINAYVNNKNLTITLNNNQMNINEIFSKFKDTLETISFKNK